MPNKIIVFLLLFLNSAPWLMAQSWDYEAYPDIQIDFVHMDADIRINEDAMIEGDIRFRGIVRHSRADSIAIDAAGMNIRSVSVNGGNKEYRAVGDKVFILLSEPLVRGEDVSVHIQYNTIPGFGIHVNSKGTIWTSRLPKATRHWLPVVDHPRISFTFEIAFTHPAGHTMIASGRRGSSELLSVDRGLTTFSSNRPVPASSLSWVAGTFAEVQSTTAQTNTFPAFDRRSDPQIYLYSESELNSPELLRNAADTFQRVQRELGVDFPFRDLHVVILEDDHWETKNYGAGVIFLSDKDEDARYRMQLGILSQWAGVHIREEQWSDASAIHLLQALFANRMLDMELHSHPGTEPYHEFSGERLIVWKYFLQQSKYSSFKEDVANMAADLFSLTGRTLSWHDLSRIIYDKMGKNYFSGFTPTKPADQSAMQGEEYHYAAMIEWEEGAATAEIYFEAIGRAVEELVSVRVTELTFTDTRTHEITFTGQRDGMAINVLPGIENLILQIEDRDDIILHLEKPYLFWIQQLREDDHVQRRADAARGLSMYTDNPDLQLLNDVLQAETAPDVIAEIVRSLSRITAGASGTDERFIHYSSFQQPSQVQLAAIEALANYRNNERVISRLRTIILQTGNQDLRREAIYSLSEVADSERFRGYVTDFVVRESNLNEVPLLLRLLAESGENDAAFDIASTFLSQEFPYSVRGQVLEMLLEYDRSPVNWSNRLPGLLSDRHPRIRYKAALALDRLSLQQRQQIISQRVDDEYDERIRRLLR